MPTVRRIGPYEFRFWSADHVEPRHIHVFRDEHSAKFWLDPITLERSHGFPRHELHAVQLLVEEHADFLRRAWDDFFGN